MSSSALDLVTTAAKDVQQITADEFTANYERIKNDPMYRLTSGKFYKIMIKGDDPDDDGEEEIEYEPQFVIPFVPNLAQIRFMNNLWWRNIILKARQLGFTTEIAIMWLDHAMWNADQRCGIIAQDKDSATKIFRDKVRFAYKGLPSFMRAMFPLETETKHEIVFAHNNSAIEVATSLRSGTIHRLHVSEFGKIGAQYPEKAREVVTGSIPAVPISTGIIVIESTAEGAEGRFHDMTQLALRLQQLDRPLTKREYRLHFYPWFENPEYVLNEWELVDISEADNDYFDEIEAYWGIELTQEQCAWYISTRDNDYPGEPELMWQEYPSTPEEAFKVSTEGCWYTKQMAAVRKEGRIKTLPKLVDVFVYTFWDIGNSDGTAIWIMQLIGHEWRVIGFFECWGEPYSTPIKWLKDQPYIYQEHFLPHDADHARQGKTANETPAEMLRDLWKGQRFTVLDVIDYVTTGIQMTRKNFPLLWFDSSLKEGITHLDGYKKVYNRAQQVWTDVPYKLDGHSEAADALRQWAQALEAGLLNARPIGKKGKKPRSWKTQ